MSTTNAEKTMPLAEVLAEIAVGLPWELVPIRAGDKWIEVRGVDARVDYDDVCHETQRLNAAYLAHAANTLPGVIAALEAITHPDGLSSGPRGMSYSLEKCRQALAAAQSVRIPHDGHFWRPAEIPAPPKRKPTQQKVDTEAFIECAARCVWESDNHLRLAAWHAAIAYEREQVRALLTDASRDYPFSDGWHPSALALARRVGLKLD